MGTLAARRRLTLPQHLHFPREELAMTLWFLPPWTAKPGGPLARSQGLSFLCL